MNDCNNCQHQSQGEDPVLFLPEPRCLKNKFKTAKEINIQSECSDFEVIEIEPNIGEGKI